MNSDIQQNKLYWLQRKVKTEGMSIRNHLMSILHDSNLVSSIRSFLHQSVLFANLRNGLWYSEKFDGKCYFKSTDGHDRHWSFSLTRMNLEFACVAATGGRGAIVVDSTRLGKNFPDSMSATVCSDVLIVLCNYLRLCIHIKTY